MKKFLTVIFLLALLAAARPAHAQFIGYTSPQTNTKTYTPVSCSGGGTGTFNVPNIGQTVHFLSYFITGNPTAVSVYFQAVDPTSLAVYQISDTSTDPINGGILTANGSYAKVQIVITCSGTGSVTVTYYGTSSNSVPATGLQDQTSYRKILAYKASTTPGTTVANVLTPYGNTCGMLQFTYESAVAGSTISVTFPPEGPIAPAGTNFTALAATALPNSTTTQYIPVSCYPTTKAVVTFQSGGAGGSFDLTYIFFKPGVTSPSVPASVTITGVVSSGAVQPATTHNSEATATGAAVTTTIAASGTTRVFLYGVTARCSAGSATLTVKDGVGGTTIWSTDAAFVGTTSVGIAWTSAPLASTAGNGMDIVLGSCGGGNTGTLDVQASQL